MAVAVRSPDGFGEKGGGGTCGTRGRHVWYAGAARVVRGGGAKEEACPGGGVPGGLVERMKGMGG